MSCAVNSAVSISGQRQVHRQKYAAYVDKAANIDLCKTVLRLALYLSGNGESVYSHMLVQFTHIIYKRQETEKYSLQKDFFKISEEVLALSEKAEKLAEAQFEKIDDITEYNQQKVLAAFINNKVSEAHLGATTGYGYDDIGRDNLDRVVAEIFGTEDALVRYSFASGTHTISTALFGLLRPGDRMLCACGLPYDTLLPVLGVKETPGSLKDFGVQIDVLDLLPVRTIDIGGLKQAIRSRKYKMLYLQRSRGYTLRPSYTAEECAAAIRTAKEMDSRIISMVDNCYGEFVGLYEPTQLGADIMAGSLIKNPGGAIARCGGYIAGRSELIELCAYRMTAPGVGREVGATLGMNRELYMGFFNAPHVTGEAKKAAVFASALFSSLGYEVSPTHSQQRGDIIQSIVLGNEQRLSAFCCGLQSGAPVDSFVSPIPAPMPGYDDKVIMSAGAFTGGSSIELSADAPLREPYAVWFQGGFNYHSAKVGIMLAAENMLKNNCLYK